MSAPLKYPAPSPFSSTPPGTRLHFVVIGAGIGGLTAACQLSRAGHKVTVVEAHAQTQDTGAGINVPPNSARILIGLGLGDLLSEHGVHPHALVYRRWQDGRELGRHSTEEIQRRHGAPYYNIHRGHLVNALIELARSYEDTEVRFACPVATINPGDPSVAVKPSVTLASGERVEGDIIIGADGIRSITRTVVTGEDDAPLNTGDAAFRSLIDTSDMKADPELAPLVDNHEVTVWMGPGRHIVAYCINGKNQYHIALARLDDATLRTTESWIVDATPEAMREGFDSWEPRVVKLLGMVTKANKRKLVDRDPLKRWIHPKGTVALLGDACHPMLPYRAQGAAMAIEDASTLGVLFSVLPETSDPSVLREAIATRLKGYFDLRLSRCSAAMLASRANRKFFHLRDGEEQVQRDERFAHANPIAVEEDNRSTFDYNAEIVAKTWLDNNAEMKSREA